MRMPLNLSEGRHGWSRSDRILLTLEELISRLRAEYKNSPGDIRPGINVAIMIIQKRANIRLDQLKEGGEE